MDEADVPRTPAQDERRDSVQLLVVFLHFIKAPSVFVNHKI